MERRYFRVVAMPSPRWPAKQNNIRSVQLLSLLLLRLASPWPLSFVAFGLADCYVVVVSRGGKRQADVSVSQFFPRRPDQTAADQG